MKVLVCGGRDFKDKEKLYKALDGLLEEYEVIGGIKVPFSELVIIEGGARGADRLAREWAIEKEIVVITYEAEWDTLGKAAGYIRNNRMLTEGKPDVVIAFPGGRGTAMMVRIAKEAGVKVIEVSAD